MSDALDVRIDGDGRLHLGWGEPDWCGPAEPIAPGPVTSGSITTDHEAAHDGSATVITLRADVATGGLATGIFERPSVGWTFRPERRSPGDAPDAMIGVGFQYTEFALPVRASADLAIWTLMPWRPPIVEPLAALAPDGRCILLGPLDTFFEQVISVPVPDDLGRGITWGWHGDLARVPAGFSSSLAVVAGHGLRETLAAYTRLVTERHGTVRPPVDADVLGASLSYWTDNGAAYWYRTEPGRDTPTTLVDTVDDLRARNIPIAAVQLDSWFYPHEVIRPFDTDEWVVPPTGLVEWEPRADVLPDGIEALRAALGDPPLVTHCRHLSSSSPLVERYPCWIDADRAQPCGPELYEHWLDRARQWGVETFEHDWLIECFLGVRGLREEVGRATAWQEGIDRASAERGLTLQWCMASPADMLQTATLSNVTSIRTSGDHGYLVGPGFLWNWFLLVNAMARGLGLRPYKDVFWSDHADAERHSDVESLLAALSSGPVGLGDRLGGADREVVMRTCLADGRIVRPDVAISAIDACFARDAVREAVPLVGEAFTDHAAGRWSYIAAIHASDNLTRPEHPGTPSIGATIGVSDLGESSPPGRTLMWDWRRGTAQVVEVDGEWHVSLEHLEWDLRVLAPMSPDGLAVVGDPRRYATAGRARLDDVTFEPAAVRFLVIGDGEPARLVGWSDHAPTASADGAAIPIEWRDGIWSIDVAASSPSEPTEVRIATGG